MKLDGVTLHQLACFHALVGEGSFQAAAEKLFRSQPSVSAAIKNLESQLGLELLDRSGYRVALTAAGRSFYERARVLLGEAHALRQHAAQLVHGRESELRVVVGDLCPLPQTLGLLRRFFDRCSGTRLHLHFEAISGPWERLWADEADLILHHVDKADVRLEFVDLCAVKLDPVVAPGYLQFPLDAKIEPAMLRRYVQCVIRDTARASTPRDYYILDGARSWTVSDQFMKKELIVQGMGWGHLPHFMIRDELADGRLVSIAGEHFKGGIIELVAARRCDRSHGPVAQRLWEFIADQAPGLSAVR
jgi:DNA-binding transcriptional LysR family regulator